MLEVEPVSQRGRTLREVTETFLRQRNRVLNILKTERDRAMVTIKRK